MFAYLVVSVRVAVQMMGVQRRRNGVGTQLRVPAKRAIKITLGRFFQTNYLRAHLTSNIKHVRRSDVGHSRLNGHRAVAVGAGRRIGDGGRLGVDVAVELVVQIEVALVLQRRAARGALEAVHVQVLVLDAHEHATERGDE